MQHYKFRKKLRALFPSRTFFKDKEREMLLRDKIKQAGATGYILLWLLGIPIPILLIIFLLRGCT